MMVTSRAEMKERRLRATMIIQNREERLKPAEGSDSVPGAPVATECVAKRGVSGGDWLLLTSFDFRIFALWAAICDNENGCYSR